MSPPVLTLPTEVLGKIFVECLPEIDSDRLDPDNAPALLCQVTSSWRQVALAEACLWDTVIFPAALSRTASSKITQQQCSLFIATGGIERWFNRTPATHLLSFGEDGGPTKTSNLINHFLPTIAKYARRLRHISVTIIRTRQFEILRRGFPHGIFDELVSVSICCIPDMDPQQLEGFHQLDTPFNGAPKLKHVTMTLLRASPMKFVLPWTRLTSIKIDNPLNTLSLPEWKSLFKTCPNIQHGAFVKPENRAPFAQGQDLVYPTLTSLSFAVIGYQFNKQYIGDWHILTTPVHYPHLKHLHLTFDLPFRTIPLLRSRKLLTKLQTLTVHASPHRPFDIPPEVDHLVEDLITHPSALPSLTLLAIPYRNFRKADLGRLLRAHPPTSHHPGLTVSAKLLLRDDHEVYTPLTDDFPDIGHRFRITEVVVAPVEWEHRWQDSESD